MNDLAVQFTGVTKQYKHFTLQNVNLELATGSITGFVEPMERANPPPSAF